MRRRILSVLLSLAMVGTICTAVAVPASADGAKTPQYQTTAREMEKLNRGLVAVKATSGVYLSWRVLGSESLATTAYDIYKKGTSTKIATVEGGKATNYTDSSGTASSEYQVVVSGQQPVDDEWVTPWTGYYSRSGNQAGYKDLLFEAPAGGSDYTYTADDMSVGDLDGDGEYELVVKWNPTNAQDNSKSGKTGDVMFDAYEINGDGTPMWRINLGPNIRAGQHYTQFLVYDFDGDGKAEMMCKTAPGSKDAGGNYVNQFGVTDTIRGDDNTKVYRNSSGYVLDGPEYLTVFDGETGTAMQTVNYDPPRTIKSQTSSGWGDTYGNRSERYLAGVAYLNGETPSALFCRGYYTFAYVAAYNWDGTNLTEQWISKNEKNSSWVEDGKGNKTKESKSGYTLYGQGAHSVSVADVDNDGKDELIFGAAVLDDDGTVLYSDGRGHGDAEHVSDFDNDGKQEVFMVHEAGKDNDNLIPYAVDIKRYNDSTKVMDDVMKQSSTGDIGRGVMDNVDDTFASQNPDSLALFWSTANGDTALTYNINGVQKGVSTDSNKNKFYNFLIYWDGDLGRELLDNNLLAKYSATSGITRILFTGDNYIPDIASNDVNKKTPGLVADIFGDWREEMVFRLANGTGARIYTSCVPTNYRLTTLMHDSQYRCAIAWQNVGYNQPPHTSYYIGSASLATDASGNKLNYLAPAIPFTKVKYANTEITTPVTGISLSPSTLRLEKGKSQLIEAIITPDNADNKTVTWETSDESKVTVTNGLVTAVGKEGSATITATAKDTTNGTYSAKCQVEVYATDVTGIQITDPTDNMFNMTTGDEKTFTAKVEPDNASEKGVEWRSTNPVVATVDANGKVTAVGMGLATIYAKTVDGGFEDAIAVNVLPQATTDKSGDDVFTLQTDAASGTFNATKTGAKLTQENNTNEATFYKTVNEVDGNNKAKLSFHYVTGGTQIANKQWNWKNHEFSMYVKLLGKNGENILTFHQPWTKVSGDTVGAGDLTTQANGESSAQAFPTGWSTVEEGKGNISGSAKTWDVEIEFDYANNKANAYICGYKKDDQGVQYVNGQYTKSFDLQDGVQLSKVEFSSKKENGCQGIYWTPEVSNFSYEEIAPSQEGSANVLYRRGEKTGIPWSESDIAAATGGFTPTGETLEFDATNKRILFNPTTPTASYSATKTFDLANDALVEYDLDWYIQSEVGSNANNYEYVQIGDNIRFAWKTGYKIFLSKDGGTTWGSDALFSGANRTPYVKNIHLVYDKVTSTVKSLSFDGKVLMSNEKLENDTMNKVTFGFVKDGNTQGWEYPCGLDNISVSQFSPTAEATFHVQFVDEDGNILDEQDVKVGEYASADDVTKPGRTVEWTPDPTTTPIVDDTVFRGTFTPVGVDTYTVTLNANGGKFDGDAATKELTFTPGAALSLADHAPTRDYYTFGGWYANVECTGDAVEAVPADTESDVTYYAKWTPMTYTVTLDTQGGTLADGADITSYTYGEEVTLPDSSQITNGDKVFFGWYENAQCEGASVEKIEKGSYGNKTYYAKWAEAGKYKITYNLLGGTLADGAAEEYTKGTPVTLPEPTWNGYTFGGWYTAEDYSGNAVESITAEDEGNKTYYAKWTSTSPAVEYASTAQDGKTVTAYVAAEKNTDMIIGALYNGTQLVEVKTAAVSENDITANLVYVNNKLMFTNDVSKYDLKLFLWNGLGVNGLKPLAAVPSVKAKEQ